MGTFSFFPSKNLGAYGDGGMIVTQDEAIAERLRRLRVHGGAKQYFHDEVGYNSRLDALQAAVLAAKLPHLARWSAKRPRMRGAERSLTATPFHITTPLLPRGPSCSNRALALFEIKMNLPIARRQKLKLNR